jgi:hypothetical protein
MKKRNHVGFLGLITRIDGMQQTKEKRKLAFRSIIPLLEGSWTTGIRSLRIKKVRSGSGK